MRKTNLILSLVLAAMLAFLAWFWIGGTLVVSPSTVTADAVKYPDAFRQACAAARDETAPQVYLDYVPDSADGCSLVGARITLHNRGWFPAEWIYATVEPVSGDLCLYELTGTEEDIPAGGTHEVILRMLTRGAAGTTRKVTLSWYIFGMKRTMTVNI